MTRRVLKIKKIAAVLLTAGFVFGGFSCVENAAQVVGTGLTLTAASGTLGTDTQTATAVGGGLNLISGVLRMIGH